MRQWRGPEYDGEFPSLGWGLIDLCESYLGVPSGPEYGKPLILTPSQKAFLVRLYRIHPVTGHRVYRRGAKVGPKGQGKSPLLFFFLFGELVGPVVFDGWDANGEPVAHPRETPWVQIAAVSEDQTDNTYIQLLSALEFGDADRDFNLDIGLTRIFVKGKRGARLEPVTAAAGSREGQPVTAAGFDEPHLWTPGNSGTRLAATIRRNVAKTNGTTMEATNAWKIGQNSVAEATAAAASKRAAGLLFDHVEGNYVDDLSDRVVLRRELERVYGDSYWIDLDRIVDECNDPGTTPEDACRFYLNIPAPEDGEESWLPSGAWESCRMSGARIVEGSPVWLGVDMSLKHDTTAVAAVQIQGDRVVADARVWEPAGDVIDIASVEAHIIDMHTRHDVVEVVYDPAYFERSAQSLLDQGVPMVEYSQGHALMVPACGHAYELINSGRLAHDADPVFSSQVLGASPRSTDFGWRLSKGRSRNKIDAAIALVMAADRATRAERKAPEPFAMFV